MQYHVRPSRRYGPHGGNRLTDRGLVPLRKPTVPRRWLQNRDPRSELATPGAARHRPAVAPERIPDWFVLRWQLEVSFHRGGEQSGNGHPASVVQSDHRPYQAGRNGALLLGHTARPLVAKRCPVTHRETARYAKAAPTFVHAIALMRRHPWIASEGLSTSSPHPNAEKSPPHSLLGFSTCWPTLLECAKSSLVLQPH